jgi:hypothetical protein
VITPPVTLITHGIVAVAAAAGAWAYQGHRYDAQLSEVRREYLQRDFKALEAQYADTIRLQKKAEDAQAKAAVRIRTLAADRDILRGAVDGLRGDLAENSARYAEATEQARANYTAAVGAVLADCAGEIGELAVKADGHVIDIRRLHEQWPE